METTTTTQTFTKTLGRDTYQLDVTTINFCVGGKGTNYKLFINGRRDMDFPSRRLNKEMKEFFGLK